MKAPIVDFWGKFSQSQNDWHPLIDHCADVAACCEALLKLTLLRRRIARLGDLDDLSPSQVSRLSVLAAYHDVGKFNIGFQNKAAQRPLFTNGHVRGAIALIQQGRFKESERLRESLSLDMIDSWGPDRCALRLLVAAIAHHGRPASFEQSGSDFTSIAWRPVRGLDPFGGIARLRERSLSWFPDAFTSGADPLPATATFQHAFSGLVTLADWIGSDTRFFPFSEDLTRDRMDIARAGARRALQAFGIDASGARHQLGVAPPSFALLSEFEPHAFQRAILDLPNAIGGSLTILESETGSGKTEAALALFLKLFHANEVDGLYFALPTRTAATQIHRRVIAAVARAFKHPPPVVLGVPGYIIVDDHEAHRLADFQVLWNDDSDERFRYRGWAAESPKRYLAGPITVGTVDQALLSTLMVSHAHMRATALLRNLLVIDEVHASDAYMIALMREVLANHLAAGGHALLMSATLGSSARRILLASAFGAAPASLPLDEAKNLAYPTLLSHRPDGMKEIAIDSDSQSKHVSRELSPSADDPPSIARIATDAVASGARVLIVRNTVADCVATQLEVEREANARGLRRELFGCGTVVAPHHSRFATEDRRDLDLALENRFGKVTDSSALPCIAVATQTVQQSLDIDADLMITDFCPMDVMLQRVGRLHRHSRPRPAGYTHPRLIVLTPAERDLTPLIRSNGKAPGPHGIGTVYEDLRILEATWRALESYPELTIPLMNRELVEATTHPQALRAIESSLGPKWHAHGQEVSGAYLAMKRVAKLNCIDRTLLFGDFEFPSKELEQRIQTRLGEGDRIAEFPAPLKSPFGNEIRRLTIPYFLARGIEKEAQPILETSNADAIEFSFGSRRFIYDRLGLRAAGQPSSESEDAADA
ncbi:MAG: CRISPR-associated helicase Cas3' [Candidatus Binatus sp.]|uniref:CRISPR-associated helicase Cas3' n=1 Tax=Candidatus Binatus sp. TaxID=2811406 RepID=UPI00271A1A18|nr:CRISPR-associated helicase Cas3' [Candidatus Binatus sp.]MDO8434696.1 CRISPR-associated helicase Cas3' [Candidatus Binatus sp.]